jgi:hypothetical protein
MQCQGRHEKEKDDHDAQLDEEQQDQSPKFFLVDFEEVRGPEYPGAPEQSRRGEIEQCEKKTDEKGSVEKVPEENNLVAVHAATIHSRESRSITKLRHIGSSNC